MAGANELINELSENLDEKLSVSATPQRTTALANKITSVLSASYADSEIRDALRTLDERRIRNSAETRRRLRLDAQKEVIERNGDVIQDFGQVAEQLKRIGSTIKSLNLCCDDMRKHVSAAKRENAPMLEDASVLLAQKRDLETKAQLLDAFNEHFIMSEDSLTILSTTSDAVNEEFFATLQRVKQIYTECQVLLGNENERLGLELMDQSSRQLNAGYQKLYRWIQKEFKNLNLENPQISSVIRRALRVLSERPTLFNGCLDLFAEAREHVLTDGFYSALTGSSGSNEQEPQMKPIEFHAHDPLRYIGDMLAWTHSTTVSEREALENLFISEGDEFKKGFEAGKEAEPWSAAENETFDGQKALGDLVNRNIAGIARALRQRIEQVLQNHEDAVLLYQIANLINFYHVTFSRLLSPSSTLLQTLKTTEESSLRTFTTILSDQAASIPTSLPQPTPLHPPLSSPQPSPPSPPSSNPTTPPSAPIQNAPPNSPPQSTPPSPPSSPPASPSPAKSSPQAATS